MSNKLLVQKYGRILLDSSQPLKKRFRALFALKNLGGTESINFISQCFTDPSALLKHELAYCLGQMSDKGATNILKQVLSDLKQEPMVRHEAGEALAAIGDVDCLEMLQCYSKDSSPEVSETCQIALERLKWLSSRDELSKEAKRSPYLTIDPAPAATETQDVQKLRNILIDSSTNSLWDRYRAMFKLRDLNSEESIRALAEGLKCEDSALFRHEIAFVLGQLQSPLVVRQLADRLALVTENPMVRHECAEALGAIGTENCKRILTEYLHDPEIVVKESCVVALDICEYNESGEFQYANCDTSEFSSRNSSSSRDFVPKSSSDDAGQSYSAMMFSSS